MDSADYTKYKASEFGPVAINADTHNTIQDLISDIIISRNRVASYSDSSGLLVVW